MRMRIFAIVLLKLLILHHDVRALQEESESDDDVVELKYEDDGFSMEELTTVTILNELPHNEANTPNKNHESMQHTTIVPSTTMQQASPILMKLISPLEPTRPFVAETTTEHLDLKIMNQTKIALDDKETPVVANKKPRILITKTAAEIPNENDYDSNSMEETTPLSESESESNETNIENGEEIATTLPPSTSKRPPKNFEIFKTRPNELLRFYVEDGHLRSPIAALVDKKANPLNKAKRLWKAALRPNSLLDIMVVSYDSEGIKSTYNLTNTKAMMSTLDKVREENSTDQKSKTYYSIIRTGQLIPFDSAIFVSTDDIPSDTVHQYQASMFLLKKRIRLYLIIFDGKNNSTNETTTTTVKETGFLGQLAMLTGGDIIYVPNYVFQNQSDDGEMGFITLFRRNKFKPIDQEPLKDFHENELKNDTETLSAKDEHHDSNN